MSQYGHPIKLVARRTGLTPHVIRIWEKRYGAVRPDRTQTNRRVYSEEEVERLALLRDLVRSGHTISTVAPLPTSELRNLATGFSPAAADATPAPEPQTVVSWLEKCLLAVKDLDARGLEEALERAEIQLGGQGLLQQVIAPLVQQIGTLWREGTITAAHEHFATAVIRVFLGHAARSFAAAQGAPVLVVATPSGQLHELGALLAAAAAANLGWRITYLGPSLPASEIAGAAIQNKARAVAMSLVYPDDDPNLPAELSRLRELLPAEIPLLIGGRAAPSYVHTLQRIKALYIADLAGLCTSLEDLRASKGKSS